jgi:tetratricopeptide (TPR) repeat protein
MLWFVALLFTSVYADEVQDRRVDQVALQSKSKAITQLKGMLKKYHGTSQEPMMYLKLAEFQQQASAIEFRIAHGEAHRTQKAPKLSRYQSSLEEVISSTQILIKKFPSMEQIDQVYWMQGSAYDELKRKDAAKKCYRYLVNHYPDSLFRPQSYMTLAEYAIEDNQYPSAIQYLIEVEKLPEDSHYPFALYKLAWAHFNQKNILKSISYLEKHIDYYRKRQSITSQDNSTVSLSDSAILEHSLLDYVSFYMEAYENKVDGFTIENALAAFRKIESGPILGPMNLRLAKHLRSHGHDSDLLYWKNQLILDIPYLPETLDVTLVSFEYFFNKRDYEKVVTISNDFSKIDVLTKKKIRAFESYKTAQQTILDAANKIQKLTLNQKEDTVTLKYVHTLRSLYDSFIQIVDEKDLRVPKIHYNLAETLFQIKEYSQATEHYLWVIQHWSKNLGINEKEVRLKLIASRYQSFETQGIIPKNIKPTALQTENESTHIDTKQLPSQITEWISWIDSFEDDFDWSPVEIENFEFEADRILYSHNQIQPALSRILKLIDEKPYSKFTIPAESLVLDTYVASQFWEKVYDTSDFFQKINSKSAQTDLQFEKRLFQTGSDAFYKTIEISYKNKDYKKGIRQVLAFEKKYPKSDRINDVLLLASRIALDNNQKDLASSFASKLLKQTDQTSHRQSALILRASLEEEQYEFDLAVQDYSDYLNELEKSDKSTQLSKSEKESIIKRIFLMTWLSSKPSPLNCNIHENQNEDLHEECERYQALIYLKDSHMALEKNLLPIKKALKGSKPNRSVWAILALKRETKLGFQDRINLIKSISTNWERLDPLAQFATLTIMSECLETALLESRKSLSTVAPLKGNSKSIEYRIHLMNEIEKAASQVAQLPWARLKVKALQAGAEMYIQFSKDLATVPTPKDLTEGDQIEYKKSIQEIVVPFEEKGKKLFAQSEEVAAEFAVQKPQNSKELQPPLSFDLAFLSELDAETNWSKIQLEKDATVLQRIQFHWASAIKTSDTGKMAFYIQELKSKTSTSSNTIKLMRTIALASTQALPEALSELESLKRDLAPNIQKKVNQLLLSHYSQSYSENKAKSILNEMEKSP